MPLWSRLWLLPAISACTTTTEPSQASAPVATSPPPGIQIADAVVSPRRWLREEEAPYLQELPANASAAAMAAQKHLLSATLAVKAETRRVRQLLDRRYGSHASSRISGVDGEKLAKLWANVFPYTAMHAWKVFEDGTIFVSTGDIKQMWLRDSSAQLLAYIPLAASQGPGSSLRAVLEGAMKRQVRFIVDDAYGSAFYYTHGSGRDEGPNKAECPPSPTCRNCACAQCAPPCGKYTYQKDFELDSLLYPLLLHYRYWKGTGARGHMDHELANAMLVIHSILRLEQSHQNRSQYYYKRLSRAFKDGIGLVWSFAQPSDDQSDLGYNIPQNIMAVVCLRHAAEMAEGPLQQNHLAGLLRKLADDIDRAVQQYGIVMGPHGKQIYAYEVDGLGKFTTMDDANMPNLLWLPYLNYSDSAGVYNLTRAFSLSANNKNYFTGSSASGLGSQHKSFGLRFANYGPPCYGSCIWHLGLITQGLTATTSEERVRCMQFILNTTADQDILHEGFDPDFPFMYNRDGFGWANALLSEWVLRDWLA